MAVQVTGSRIEYLVAGKSIREAHIECQGQGIAISGSRRTGAGDRALIVADTTGDAKREPRRESASRVGDQKEGANTLRIGQITRVATIDEIVDKDIDNSKVLIAARIGEGEGHYLAGAASGLGTCG